MTWQTALYVLLALGVGMLSGIHIPINGALGHRIQSALTATFVFYGIAFAAISVLLMVRWDVRPLAALRTVNPWLFSAGLISVLVVGGSTFLIPRIGAFPLFVLVFATQMLVRMTVSHFGWLESPVSPVSAAKLVGALLLVAGAVLTVRG